MESVVIPDGIAALIAGLFGAVIGSFLNVCIVRWPAEQSVVKPRSRCPKCGYQIAWYDNVPVVSWLVLGGKCRSCRTPIGILYPLVELATALLWAAMGWRFGLSLEALKGALFLTILLGIAMTDAREYLIPDEFTIGGLVLGLLFAAAGGGGSLLTAVIGAGVGFGLLWLVGLLGTWAFKEEAMGGGDIKMMAMVGAFVGWQGVLLTIFMGALTGTIIFLPLTLAGRKKLVPFGVFLAIGAALTYLVGPTVFEWYRNFIGAA
jgi:leader peptidase (prepilin peptidase)/N-methyltransferase